MNVLKFLLSKSMVQDNDVLVRPNKEIDFEFGYFTIRDTKDKRKKVANEELVRLLAKYLKRNSSVAKAFATTKANYPIHQQIVDIWHNEA